MKYKAVCIRCGTFKKDALATCSSCQLIPKTDFEAARALILSLQTEYAGVQVGKTIEELKNISEQIKSGRPFAIDGDEQSRVVRAYYAYLKTLPPPKWYHRRNFWWFAAGTLLLIATLIAVAYFLKK